MGVGAGFGVVVAGVVFGAVVAGFVFGAVDGVVGRVVVGVDVAEVVASGDAAVVGLLAELLADAAAGAAASGLPLVVALEHPPSATISATPDIAAAAAVNPETRLAWPFEPHVLATSTPRIPACETVSRHSTLPRQGASWG